MDNAAVICPVQHRLSLPTLLRIALVFGVGLEFFFAGARDKPLVAVTRRKERVELPERRGRRDVAYRLSLGSEDLRTIP